MNSSNRKDSFIAKLNAGSLYREMLKHVGNKPITCFCISDDGKLLGLGMSDFSIKFIDAENFQVNAIAN